MGKKSISKGKRAERELVKILNEAGLNAQRMAPMQAGESLKFPDVLLTSPSGENFRIEVKHRERLPEYLWNWLERVDVVYLDKNYKKEGIVLIRLSDFIKLVKNQEIPF